MKKSNSDRPAGIEIQRGKIDMNAQYNAGFEREPEMTMRDMRNMAMRRDMMTMTKHEPKR
jgi:hypothetical protein